jgi:hypothetical protein
MTPIEAVAEDWHWHQGARSPLLPEAAALGPLPAGMIDRGKPTA